MTPSVLFTVADANQVANALPVAERLLERDVRCRLLVLDPVYHMNARPAVAGHAVGKRVEVVDAPARALPVPFGRLPLAARMNAVRALGPQVLAAAGDHDAVVVGMDGTFERLVLRRHRRAGRFTAILWHSLVKRQPRLGQTDVTTRTADFAWMVREWAGVARKRTLLRTAAALGLEAYVPELPGHTPVDALYTAGRFVTEGFRSQGVRAPIETTGIPRFAPLMELEPGLAPEIEPRTVMYLTGSFSRRDGARMARCQQEDLDALAEALPARGWHLRIRVHPREDLASYARFEEREGISVSTRADKLWTELARVGVVVTAMSTAGLEALALGRPLLVFLGTFPPGLKEITIGRHPQIPVARTIPDVLAALDTLSALTDPGALALGLGDFVHPETPRAAEHIAASILRHVEQGERVRAPERLLADSGGRVG